MRIGIVTPAFNVASFVGAAIGSVLAQTHRDWRMTIVDDGSTDATAAIVSDFDDPRLRLVRQSNAGVSAARNRGLAATDADAVLFLDADDWLSPGALAVLAASLRAVPGAIASVGPFQRVSAEGIARGQVRRPSEGDLLARLLVRNLFANGGHVLIRRAALRKAGLFHTGLSYGEDWEYWIRLACLGQFTAIQGRSPVLFVRERRGSAYLSMATRPESFTPCMDAIFGASAVTAMFSTADLTGLRRRAEAENDWIVGRELVRHGRYREGRAFLRRSVCMAPGFRRAALLVLGSVPLDRVGPFRRYSVKE
jgi:glycosyltransferase involved in cell wall biosynthesis